MMTCHNITTVQTGHKTRGISHHRLNCLCILSQWRRGGRHGARGANARVAAIPSPPTRAATTLIIRHV